jgi:hypothetical protein
VKIFKHKDIFACYVKPKPSKMANNRLEENAMIHGTKKEH